eukprot:337883-Pelagomonas_calceolata.AAC.1
MVAWATAHTIAVQMHHSLQPPSLPLPPLLALQHHQGKVGCVSDRHLCSPSRAAALWAQHDCHAADER